ncbi:MAG: hypothetical protein GXY32_03580 [Ruminococcaceae bacterium]|nr:hypothetical protein [Oscillospiraceae bacterium]
MQRTRSVQKLTTAALLIAIGIIIPMFSPLKILIEPASFTLASHVAVMLAMFISPGVAGAVAVGTTLGFFFGGFPIVIVLRAATHVVWAVLGSLWLSRHPGTLSSPAKSQLFSLVLGLVHGALEFIVVSMFYLGGTGGSNFLYSVLLLVGVGSVVHSMVDFLIALIIAKALSRNTMINALFINANN